MENQEIEYAGFWTRTGASIIDSLLYILLTIPLFIFLFWQADPIHDEKLVPESVNFLISWVLPTIITLSFWIYKQATPGKMAISAKIVDATTGQMPTTSQLVLRYVGYFVSMLPLFLGYIWVAFDKRKQGFHDKIAGTVVIKKVNTGPEPVQFKNY